MSTDILYMQNLVSKTPELAAVGEACIVKLDPADETRLIDLKGSQF